jgi:hypothetical protein
MVATAYRFAFYSLTSHNVADPDELMANLLNFALVLAQHDTRDAWQLMHYGQSHLPGTYPNSPERRVWAEMLDWLHAHDPYWPADDEDDDD